MKILRKKSNQSKWQNGRCCTAHSSFCHSCLCTALLLHAPASEGKRLQKAEEGKAQEEGAGWRQYQLAAAGGNQPGNLSAKTLNETRQRSVLCSILEAFSIVCLQLSSHLKILVA
jgi:hypothetical protein